MKFSLGLMSGTSGDGLSLALCGFEGRRYRLAAYRTVPYSSSLRKQILRGARLSASEISLLNFQLGEFFAEAAVRFLKKFSGQEVRVIGSHGQTIYHGAADNPRNTFQIGEAAIIAERTKIPVVSDFRPGDIAAGGQGAPLIPFFDEFFFGGGKLRVLQNIGGIGNVTFVGERIHTLAFDTGPGNCLIDLAVEKLSRGKMKYDAGGKMAARGKILRPVVHGMLRHSYFRKKPPKSTGRELFNESFIPKFLWKEKTEDIIATLTYFTAYSIYHSYFQFFPHLTSPCPLPKGEGNKKSLSLSPLLGRGQGEGLDEIIISGGGALNLTLMNHLKNLFSPVPVRSIADYGFPPQAKEPAAFAFFALRALEGKINHCPAATGARQACVLGKITR